MAYSDEVFADNPIVYYRLGESSGTTAVDSSGNGRDGVYQNAPTLGVSGLLVDDPDTAVDFDGDDTHIDVPSLTPLEGTGAFTIDLWQEWDEDGNDDTTNFVFKFFDSTENELLQWFAHKEDDDFRLRVDAGGNHIVINDDPSNYADVTRYVAIVYDGDAVSLYRDGSLVESASLSGNVDLDMGSTYAIGWDESTSGNPFNGVLDEFAVYDVALSAARIQTHFDVGTGQDNEPPNQPDIFIDRISARSVDLSSSAFSDPDEGDVHTASTWEVDVAGGDFSDPVYSQRSTMDLTSHSVPDDTLTPGIRYIARVGHEDPNGEVTFSDASNIFTTDLWEVCPTPSDPGWVDCPAPGGNVTYPQLVLEDEPEAYYRLGDEQGTSSITDSSGHGRHLTPGGDPIDFERNGLLVDDSDTCAFFVGGGANQFGGLGDQDWQNPLHFSLEFLVRLGGAPTGGFRPLWNKRFDLLCGISNGRLRCDITNVQSIRSGVIDTDAIHHVVFTWDRSVLQMWINGVLEGEETAEGAWNNTEDVLWVGAHDDLGIDLFGGFADEVAFYDHVLDPDRIDLHYQASLGNFPFDWNECPPAPQTVWNVCA